MLIRNSREKDNRIVDAAGDFSQHTLPREMPKSIEAEQALLGAILVNNYAYDRVSEFLSAEHFFDPLHAQIFDAIAQLIQEGKQAVPVTLAPFFEAAGPIDDDLTVPQYLLRLAVNATTIINAKDYGRTIHDLYTRRQIILLAEDMANSAFDAPIDFPPSSQVEEAEKRLGEMGKSGDENRVTTFGGAIAEALSEASAAYQRGGHLSGLPTGLRDLDSKMGGLQAPDLIIIGGRPSMGKTALATNIAYSVARNLTDDGEVCPVDFYSLEMRSSQIAARILAEQSGIGSDKIRRGSFSEDEFRRLSSKGQQITATPLSIDDRGGISIDQFRARARRQHRKSGSKLIVVDYLQLMAGRSRNTVDELTFISQGLKALAMELKVPIIALSQLSRDLEKRDDKRPMLSDLRGSGSIEQDADVIMFCYRDEYYVERRKPPEHDLEKYLAWESDMRNAAGKAEIIVGKNRHGPIGTVQVSFDSALTKFSDLARDDRLPERYQ